MIINKGFSFNNYVGEYEIVNYDEDNDNPDLSNNDNALIISTDDDVKSKNIYSFNTNTTKSIALSFASVDINNIQSILSFCNQYGLTISSKLLNKDSVNYYLFGLEISEQQYASIYPYYKKDYIPLLQFKQQVLQMNKLITLKSAFEANDDKTMFNCITYLLFNNSYQIDDEYIPITPSSRFVYYFNEFCNNKKNKLTNLTLLQDKINAFLDHLLLDAKNYKNNGHSYIEYEDLIGPTWQDIHRVFNLARQVSCIESINESGDIIYEKNLDPIWIKEFKNHCGFSSLISSIINDILNEELQIIRPEMRFIDNNFIGDWKINTLLSAMYMELFVLISPNTLIKKCGNPTCNDFFESTPENTRKIYCSERCASLMAKRKQRAREKSEKNNNI
ncbi:MAG: CGNR zinc finger domain-containing protein [Clostridium sp.]|uniref:CGNR zinc finger domain-containing protein n=1 Tax=Clostridium sp. TaxID=1506 RepID=UPI0028FDD0BD|nr:CGNR zinc finger domain-containing protein [Clostridium sp.]MDU1604958.1 CGNR zinc finger domain-containing protein [Clostridium sp.]